MAKKISFILNGNEVTHHVEDHWTLLHFLREELELMGTKVGCGSGECGACTVIIDGKALNSYIYLAIDLEGKEDTTIEGMASNDGTLYLIQEYYVENGGIQFGFCSPGMIIFTKALLDENKNPDENEIKHALAGNICRCTGYVQIPDSVKKASQR